VSESQASEPQGGVSPVARSGWRTALVGIAAFLVAALAVGGTQLTSAAWTDDEYVTPTVTSGSVSAPTNLICLQSGGLLSSSIPISWTAPTTGPAPTSYTVYFAGTAGTGSFTVTGTSAVITGGLLSIGSAQVTVAANYSNWQSVRSNARTISLVLVLGWGCS
jgi:predicted ribosomally synthesized peptide with SipW-like signal peptide